MNEKDEGNILYRKRIRRKSKFIEKRYESKANRALHCLILRTPTSVEKTKQATRIFKRKRARSGKDLTECGKRKCGGVAQLGEHLPCKQGVRSSILLISTTWANSSAGDGSCEARDVEHVL